MKRLVALLLAIFAVMSLAACRKNEEPPEDTTLPEEETTAKIEDETDLSTEDETEAATDAETNAETEAVTDKEAETSNSETTAVSPEMNEEKAVSIARAYLGEKDPDTGYTYSYQFFEMTPEGDYKIRVSWYLPEDERYSTCGYLIVTPEGAVSKFDW